MFVIAGQTDRQNGLELFLRKRMGNILLSFKFVPWIYDLIEKKIL